MIIVSSIILFAIVFSIACGQMIAWTSFMIKEDKPMGPPACGRIHLGPVEDHGGQNHYCAGCDRYMTPDESLTYFKIRREVIGCREKALLGAKTR
jgi:hypothetical protein